jgi:DNA invertase Pin-like site-specific DNA recombinase
MTCAIYARVSTRDKGQDFTNQLLALREFAAKQWNLYCEYVDQVTGSTDERPEFQRMFQDASQRKFDVLLFWSLDRLSRGSAGDPPASTAAHFVWHCLALIHRAIPR